MRLEINVGELLYDISNKSHEELEVAVPNVEARYPVEAGTDKREDLCRLVTTALSRLHTAIQRFTVDPPMVEAAGGNAQEIDGNTTIVLTLQDSGRRRREPAVSAAQLVHSYLVNSVLSMFYETKLSPDPTGTGNAVLAIAKARAAEADTDFNRIRDYLFTKNRPERSVPDTNED